MDCKFDASLKLASIFSINIIPISSGRTVGLHALILSIVPNTVERYSSSPDGIIVIPSDSDISISSKRFKGFLCNSIFFPSLFTSYPQASHSSSLSHLNFFSNNPIPIAWAPINVLGSVL